MHMFYHVLFRRIYTKLAKVYYRLRRRHNQTPSNILLHGSYDILVVGAQGTQRTTRNEFQSSLQPDWQIDNGFS